VNINDNHIKLYNLLIYDENYHLLPYQYLFFMIVPSTTLWIRNYDYIFEFFERNANKINADSNFNIFKFEYEKIVIFIIKCHILL